MAIKVHRGGATHAVRYRQPDGRFCIGAEIEVVLSAGGKGTSGQSIVRLRIEPSSFKELARRMIADDAKAAVRAFGAALLSAKVKPDH